MEEEKRLDKPCSCAGSKPWLIWLLAATTIALLVLSAILVLQNQQLKKQLAQSSQPVNLPAPVSKLPTELTPVAGWNTYNNNQYGFEFKYPDNMIAVEAKTEWDDLVGLYFQEKSQAGSGDIRLLVNHNPEKMDIFTFYGNARVGQSGDPIFTLLDENGQRYGQIIMKKTGSGEDVYQLNDQYCVDVCHIATFLKGDYVYKLISHSDTRIIQDQILASFRFLDGESEKEGFRVIEKIPEGYPAGSYSVTNSVMGPLGRISIIFNREIDEASLNSNTFYVLSGIEYKEPGTIEYDEVKKTASYVFSSGFEYGSVTVVIKGIKDTEGNQIEELTYNVEVVDG